MNLESILTLMIERVSVARTEFIQVRVQDDTRTNVLMTDGRVDEVSSIRMKGASARAYRNGIWAFAAVAGLSDKQVRDVVSNAFRIARFTRGTKTRPSTRLRLPPPVKERVKIGSQGELTDTSLEQKVGFLRDLSRQATTHIRCKIRTRLVYTEKKGKVSILDSNGLTIEIPISSWGLIMSISAKKKGKAQEVARACGGQGEFEVINNEKTLQTVVDLVEQAERLTQARRLRSGVFRTVLDPETAGVIVHEAVGHASESDIGLSPIVMSRKSVGDAIASSTVTVVDDPTIPNLAGSLSFDDEGTLARQKKLISNGRLSCFMTDMATANQFRLPLTGNARCQDYRYPPIVRMTNTFMIPGTWKMEEMIEATRSGIYLAGPAYGRIDYNKGVFELKCAEAALISKGRLTDRFAQITAVGRIRDTLKKIVATGDDLRFGQNLCRKFAQDIDLTIGSPHIMVKNLAVFG